MSKFIYIGPSSTLFLSKDKSRPLVSGEAYSDLDETHPQVANLIAHKLLVKQADPAPETVKPGTKGKSPKPPAGATTDETQPEAASDNEGNKK